MRNKRFVTIIASLLAIIPAVASAQDKKFYFSLGGGYTQPNAEVSDRLGGGYNFNIGFEVKATPVIGIEGLYSFNGFGDKDLPPLNIAGNPGGATQLADLSGDMSMQYGTASLIVQKPDGSVRPYGLVGMGLYYRKVRLTSPGVGWVPGYCDPWWYVCYPGGWVETTNILGDRSSTDFGMSFGGGLNFGALYAELRYHYVWGPEVESRSFTGPAGGTVTFDGRKANGQFLQTNFGLRF
jgi:opacity protein-like surface antigen